MWWVNVATFRMLSIHTLDTVPTVATLGSWPQIIITLNILIMSTVTMDQAKKCTHAEHCIHNLIDYSEHVHTHTHTHTHHTANSALLIVHCKHMIDRLPILPSLLQLSACGSPLRYSF